MHYAATRELLALDAISFAQLQRCGRTSCRCWLTSWPRRRRCRCIARASRSLVISCPCGCGVHHPINLDGRSGPAWRLYRNSLEESALEVMSLYPSVWRTEGCKSHYVIWRGRIRLFDARRGSHHLPAVRFDDQRRANILKAISREYRLLVDIADDVSEIPWDTLDALRKLEKERIIEEGDGPQQGHFRLRMPSDFRRW